MMTNKLYHEAKAFLSAPTIYDPPGPDEISAAYVKATDRMFSAKLMIERLANCLEDEVNANYPDHMLEYPHNCQKKKNDMEDVADARALLTQWKDDRDE